MNDRQDDYDLMCYYCGKFVTPTTLPAAVWVCVEEFGGYALKCGPCVRELGIPYEPGELRDWWTKGDTDDPTHPPR